MLKLDIYGLRVRINFHHPKVEEDVARLLKIFLREDLDEVDVFLDYKEKGLPRAIGSQFFPHLAGKDIWGIHAGGFHLNGGHLTVGPPNRGKSMLSYMAMKNGFFVVSDDITLLRESIQEIEMLPFFSSIFLKGRAMMPESGLFKPAILKFLSNLEHANRLSLLNKIAVIANLLFSAVYLKGREIVLEQERIKPAILKYIIFPIHSDSIRSTYAKRVEKKADLLKDISPQLLWSYDKEIQERQTIFLEKLCDYPAFEIFLGSDLRENFSLFEDALNEVSQG